MGYPPGIPEARPKVAVGDLQNPVNAACTQRGALVEESAGFTATHVANFSIQLLLLQSVPRSLHALYA